MPETRNRRLPLTVTASLRPGGDAVAVPHRAQPCVVMIPGPSTVRSGGVDGGGLLPHGQRRGGD